MLVTFELDAFKLIQDLTADIESDHNFAYPDGYFDEGQAHTALQLTKGRIRAVKRLLENLTKKDGFSHASNPPGTNRSPQENPPSPAPCGGNGNGT